MKIEKLTPEQEAKIAAERKRYCDLATSCPRRSALTSPSSKDYTVEVSWSDDDGAFVASCKEIPACVVAAEDEATAVARAREAIDDHLQYRQELGLPDPARKERAYSGRLLIRIPALAAPAKEVKP